MFSILLSTFLGLTLWSSPSFLSWMPSPCFFFYFLPEEIIKGCECSLGDIFGTIPSLLICCILIVHAFATVYNYSLFWFDDCRLKSNWNSSLSHPTSFSALNLPSLTFWFFFQQTMSSQCLPRIQNSFLRCFFFLSGV